MKKRILLATEKPFSAAARDQVVAVLADAGYDVRVLEKYSGKPALLDAVGDVHAAIVRSDIVDQEVLAAAKDLKLVVRAGAGYDNIDCSAATARDVLVMTTPGQNANAVAELALGMMVYLARGKFNGKSGGELLGKTLGVHALGAVGRAVARIARGFGMDVAAYDPFVDTTTMRSLGVEPVQDVEGLYRRSQYVSLHIPATEETKKSIGKRLLTLMPAGATLVNTARKEVINENELIEVMSGRKDFRYLSDIRPSEATERELEEKFSDRVYFTPAKMGAQTEEANVNAGLAAAHQIVAFFERGERKFIVNA